MAGNRIKGITVEIGGDTTKLQTALKGVNMEILLGYYQYYGGNNEYSYLSKSNVKLTLFNQNSTINIYPL